MGWVDTSYPAGALHARLYSRLLTSPGQNSFLAPLEQRDRVQIVDLTSNFQMIDPRADPANLCANYLAQPVTANSFLLMAHGASFEIGGKGTPRLKAGHRSILRSGRTFLIRVRTTRFASSIEVLLPFGLRAVLIKEASRAGATIERQTRCRRSLRAANLRNPISRSG